MPFTTKNYISEFEDMIAAYESLLSFPPIFLQANNADEELSPFFAMSIISILVDPINHPSHHGNRRLGMRLPGNPLCAVPRVPEFLWKDSEVLQIPRTPAPPSVEGGTKGASRIKWSRRTSDRRLSRIGRFKVRAWRKTLPREGMGYALFRARTLNRLIL